jgi:hypothetical protein
MGTFNCKSCKKQWFDVVYFSCPECHPRWVLVQGILVIASVVGFGFGLAVAVFAAIFWFVGWF